MKKDTRQYTIRNIPLYVDKRLREKAKMSHKSFNQVVLEAILLGSENAAMPVRELSHVIGSMEPEEADLLEEEIKLQKQIDKDLWK